MHVKWQVIMLYLVTCTLMYMLFWYLAKIKTVLYDSPAIHNLRIYMYFNTYTYNV